MVQIRETFSATILQRVAPGSELIPVQTRLPRVAERHYRHLRDSGFRLTAEALPTGEIEVAIEHPRRGVISRDLVRYGSPIHVALTGLVLDFDNCGCLYGPDAKVSPSRCVALAQSE